MSAPSSKAKRVALMQPTFLPWQGYFGLIHDADLFVFLDDFQFVRRSYHQRNRLFLNKDDAGFISVPVAHKGDQEQCLNEAQLQIDPKWVRKTVSAIRHNYGFSERLDHYAGFVEDWLGQDFPHLAAFNMHFIRFVMDELGIETETALGSSYSVAGQRSEKIKGLLAATGATTYLSARGSYDYMKEDSVFEDYEVELLFQDFHPPFYPQRQAPEFVPYLSILDSLLQNGPERTKETVLQGAGCYTSWDEME
ncbi:MAG: WbqC family protein [Rhodospirillales bacterium]|nr:WbqC family protein [Rhodospirillales bacterium]MCB9995383.1 WbqC family protein [Rhodospirillales bacterium]